MVGRRGYASAASTQTSYHHAQASGARKGGRESTTFHHLIPSSHHAASTSSSIVPPPSVPIINPRKALEDQVETLIYSLQPCKRSEERRTAVYEFIYSILEERFPCVRCHLMGSFPLKTYLADSDLDITISTCTCRVSVAQNACINIPLSSMQHIFQKDGSRSLNYIIYMCGPVSSFVFKH